MPRPPAKPVIAAVEGYALAGGFEIALACDLIVASEEAMFGLPEVTRGLVAAAGGLLRLPRRIPYHLAMEIALTGERVSAARLEQAGLITQLVPAGQALDQARQLAFRLAQNAPLALEATKRIVAESADWPSTDAFARQNEIAAPVFTSADAMEGAAAFAEKRPPVQSRPAWPRGAARRAACLAARCGPASSPRRLRSPRRIDAQMR